MSQIDKNQLVATFSIAAADPATGEVGVAVQSKFLAVGSVVPWVKAGVGAIATQSWANTSYGPRGWTLLEQGLSPEEVVEELVDGDEGKNLRQVAVVSANGEAAAFTGAECFDWAGHKVGRHHSAQGNILVSEVTVTAMRETFERATGTLAERLLEALAAAQQAGGDSRGKQSAAVYVQQEGAGYGGYNDVKVDLRVDDHPEPIDELQRLYKLHQLFNTPSENFLALEGDVFEEVKRKLVELQMLDHTEYPAYKGPVKDALKTFALSENFDDRWTEDNQIDEQVYEFLLAK